MNEHHERLVALMDIEILREQRDEALAHLIGLHAETGYDHVEEFLKETLGPSPAHKDGSWV